MDKIKIKKSKIEKLNYDGKGFLKLSTFAKLTGYHYMTIYLKVKAGKIPAVRYGSLYLIPVDYYESLKGGSQWIE